MSRTLSAPRWGSGAFAAGLLALAIAALLAVCLTPRADAAFTTGKCTGADIAGRGASFARDAHNAFITNFKPFYCKGTPALAAVTYEAAGSGAGRLSVKVREVGGPRFGMSDEPPTTAEVAQMNAGTGNEPAGTDVNPADNGEIHVIPAAVGAVAPLVNFPNGCDATKLPDASKTSTDAKLLRVRFTKDQFEKIWAKDAAFDTWREVFPTLDDTAECKAPIVRVVRFDDSGTSFTFKDYLDTIDPAEGWLTTYAAVGGKTREWPGATFGDRDDCGDKDGIAEASDPDGPGAPGLVGDTDNLTSSCSGNAENLTDKLIATDGAIAYADISTARSKGLAVNPAGGDVDTYWTQIQNGSGDFEEPTFQANGFRTDGPAGANCLDTTFTDIPATTTGNWAPASGVNSPDGYGICTLTYGLVFDDNADVWGNSPAEEAKARTVKDYWSSIVSDAGQALLFPKDYAPLPDGILALSKAGVESIDWNKGEGGGNNNGGGGNTGGGNNTGGGSTPPTVPPSNKFTLPRKTISSKTGGATVSVKVPGAGVLEMVGTAKVGKKTIKVGRTVLNANKAGTFNLALKPSSAAKQQLGKTGSLKITLKLTFTPTGGSASTTTTGLTLKLSRRGK